MSFGNSSLITDNIIHVNGRCRVNYKSKNMNSVTFQRFHCITLNIAGDNLRRRTEKASSITLMEALTNFFTEEVVSCIESYFIVYCFVSDGG